MNPEEIKYYNNGNPIDVEIIIKDFQGSSIGIVDIDQKKHYVIRWNYGKLGFPQSSSKPAWMLLPYGLKLSIEI